MTSEPPTPDMPPRAVLYGVYAALFVVLVTVLIIVGVYV